MDFRSTLNQKFTQNPTKPMNLNQDNPKVWRDAFLSVVDAHYGTSYHHIGDGDGIPKTEADQLRVLIDIGYKQQDKERTDAPSQIP